MERAVVACVGKITSCRRGVDCGGDKGTQQEAKQRYAWMGAWRGGAVISV